MIFIFEVKKVKNGLTTGIFCYIMNRNKGIILILIYERKCIL